MRASELRSVTCCVRSSGGASRLDFGGFTTVLGMFFADFGCFWRGRHRGIVQRLAAQSGRKVWKNWEKTCRLSLEDASGSEYLQ